MRNAILWILAVVGLAFEGEAQITITATDMTSAFANSIWTTYRTNYDVMPLNLGSVSGSAQVWDFSNVTGTVTSRDTTTAKYYPPAGYPAAAQFPGATVAQVAQTVAGSQTTTEATYFQVTSTGVYILGLATLIKNPPAPDSLSVQKYNTPSKFIPLPATYGTQSVSSDTLPYDYQGLSGFLVTNRTIKANGFGTLKFPNGAHPDAQALRVDAATDIVILYQTLVIPLSSEHDINFFTQDFSQVYFTNIESSYTGGTTNVQQVSYQIRTGTTTAIGESPVFAPTTYSLEQNYPNPFNPSTTIQYDLPRKSSVSLVVYNALGQQVASLVNRDEEAGNHAVRLDGSTLASGVYFYRLVAGDFVATKKLVLMK
jgi:hypothetical protein